MGPKQPRGHETPNRRTRNLALLERTAKVMELCRRRDPIPMTFDAIAAELGLSHRSVAWSDYQRGLRMLREDLEESTIDARESMLARFDAMAAGLMLNAESGDTEAVKAMLAIDKQRADLQGLNAPKPVAVTNGDGGPVEIRIVHAKPESKPKDES